MVEILWQATFAGMRPLHHACNKNHEGVIRYLVKAGAEINCVDENGDTCLHWACARGVLNVVVFLVENGANYSITNGQVS